MKLSICLLGILVAAFVVACGGSESAPQSPSWTAGSLNQPQTPRTRSHRSSYYNPITRVFVIVQENRTVDNLFNGFPNAETQSYGYYQGQKISLYGEAEETSFDLGHTLQYFNTDTGCPDLGIVPWSCPMNDFPYPGSASGSGSSYGNAYAYVLKSYTKPYWDMAKQYVFGDHMFQSNLDGSYVAHQYLIAAQANSTVNFPALAQGQTCKSMATPAADWITNDRMVGSGSISACQIYPTTIVTELGQAQYNWRYYNAKTTAGVPQAYWDPFFWIVGGATYGYGHDVRDPCQFLTDIANPSGYSPSVTWITPSGLDSDHAGITLNYYGPDWVTAVVNAIGSQKDIWKHSVIFITWDDWGGWYDHVVPPYANYDGLGIRVPFIIISPYIKSNPPSGNWVTHTQYEQASILRYIEDLYGLGTMAPADRRANDPANDSLNFWNLTGTPRPFATISPYPAKYKCDSPGAPDDE